MTLPIKFRKTRDKAIASFNFEDIATGTGTQAFFLGVGKTSGGETHNLLSTAITSWGTDGGDGKRLIAGNFDFDTSNFNLPRTVTGTAILSGEFSVVSDANVSLTVQIMKFDGSTETNISSIITSQTADFTATEGFLIEIPLTTTIIKRGELLRANIIVTAAGSSNVQSDPLGAAGNEPLRLLIPFKIGGL